MKKAIIIRQFRCECGKLVSLYFDRQAIQQYDEALKLAEKAIAEGKVGPQVTIKVDSKKGLKIAQGN